MKKELIEYLSEYLQKPKEELKDRQSRLTTT